MDRGQLFVLNTLFDDRSGGIEGIDLHNLVPVLLCCQDVCIDLESGLVTCIANLLSLKLSEICLQGLRALLLVIELRIAHGSIHLLYLVDELSVD